MEDVLLTIFIQFNPVPTPGVQSMWELVGSAACLLMVTGTHVSHSHRTELRECGKTNGRVNTTPHFTVGAGPAGEPGSGAGAKRAFNGLILPPLHTVPATAYNNLRMAQCEYDI